MIIQIFMAAGAVVCTVVVARYIWQERGCFGKVARGIRQELNTKHQK